MTETQTTSLNGRLLPSHRERREDERFISDWGEQADRLGTPPPLTAFRLSLMGNLDWAYRFLVFATDTGQSAFMVYGLRFAQLLGLPDVPAPLPMLPQLPELYQPIFAKGCRDAARVQAPVRISGAFDVGSCEREVYRAVFAAVALEDGAPGEAVLGAFNRRVRRRNFSRSGNSGPRSPGVFTRG